MEFTATIPTTRQHQLQTRINEHNNRIATRGLSGDPITLTTTNPRWVDEYYLDQWGHPVGGAHVVDATITFTVAVLLGDWTVTAIAQWDNDELPLIHNFDNQTRSPHSFDRNQCDHCNTQRNRNMVVELINNQNETRIIGSTCMVDYTGHNPTRLLVKAANTFINEFDGIEDEYRSGSGGTASTSTQHFVAAALHAINLNGYTPTRTETASSPTRDVAQYILFDPRGADLNKEALTDANLAAAQQIIDWATAHEPGVDASSFDWNLYTTASSETISRKREGFAAYLPEAYRRHLETENQTAANMTAEPVPTGRQTVCGAILRFKTVESAYGTTIKMTVEDQRGFRVYTTVPKAILDTVTLGSVVQFDATLTRSTDSDTFGFAKRPTKAAVLEGGVEPEKKPVNLNGEWTSRKVS